MPRVYTVPQYLLAAAVSGLSNRRTINSNSPGTTDDITTTHAAPTALAASSGYLTPGGASAAGPLNAVGTSSGRGWATAGSTAVPAPITAGLDGFTVEAGNWVLPISYKRPGGVLTGDVVNATFTAVLFKIDVTTGAGIQEVGRASVTVPSITTTKASSTITIAGAEMVVSPGEHRWQTEVHVSVPAAVLSDSIQFLTNSTTSSRFTAIPPFSAQFRRPQSDTPVVSDAMQRSVSLSRPQVDSIALTDPAFVRMLALQRPRSDSIALSDPPFVRRLDLVRAQADSAAITDPPLLRLGVFSRPRSDAVTVSDSMLRVISLSRALRDDIAQGGSATVIRRTTQIFDD